LQNKFLKNKIISFILNYLNQSFELTNINIKCTKSLV
jgi:hypothetical protein